MAGTSARANHGPNGPRGLENAFWRQLGIHNLRSAGRKLADMYVRCAARLCLRDSKTGACEGVLGAAACQFVKSIEARRAKDGMLLPHGSVLPLEGSNCYERVRTKWQAIRASADLPPTFRMHDLRHSFASHAIMSGESLLTTSRLRGRSRLETTARYAYWADDMLLTSAEKIGMLIMVQAIGK